MPENTNKAFIDSIPHLAGLFIILFLTAFLPSLYFFADVQITNQVIRALLLAGMPFLYIPFIYWISIRYPVLKNWKTILLHIIVSILYSISFLLLFQILIFFILGSENFLALPFDRIIDILARQFYTVGTILFFSYWGIVVLFGLKKYYEERELIQQRATDIQSQLEEATLTSLQAQLKPHFLFNTLSMVDQMITKNPGQAEEMIDKLDRLLRNSFDRNHSESCTIKEEVEFLKKYLSIEASRFHDRLSVKYMISDATKDVMIPRFLLQPLVENTIIHGVSKTMKESVVLVKSEFLADQLVLSVENNFYGSHKNPVLKHNGIGLKNVQKRIKLYFGDEARLNVATMNTGVFFSRILIPKKYLKRRSASYK